VVGGGGGSSAGGGGAGARAAPPTLRFLTDDPFRQETRRRAYDYARRMSWPNVGHQSLELYTRLAPPRRVARPQPAFRVSAGSGAQTRPGAFADTGL
jgi:hypothetical protein